MMWRLKIGVRISSSTMRRITAHRALTHERGQPEADDEPDGRLERDPQADVDHQRGRGDQEVRAVVGVVLVGDRDGERPDLRLRDSWAGTVIVPFGVWIDRPGRGTAGLTVAARARSAAGRSALRPR